MKTNARRWALAVVIVAAAAACATGSVIETQDGSTGSDSSTGNDGAVAKDSGSDATTCSAPLVKCFADAGTICVDTKTDPNHCGQCTTTCTAGDAGALQPGPNNPDAGVPFDGGYDGGIGWSLGTPACDASNCAVACPQGFVACSDGVCYDPQNFHDHCGACTTACQSTEWCGSGHCCATGTEWCGSSCIDVLSDPSNCGACGHVCPSQTPVCSGGACTTAIIYSQAFVANVTATAQCTAWNTFRTALSGTYSKITMTGTNDSTGRSCTGTSANTICQALHNGTTVSNLSCGGYMWNVDNCTGIELTADNMACYCTNPGYNLRPCITNGNWGGVNTNTCPGPSQTMTVMCQ